MFNQFVKRPVFFCGGGMKNSMKKLISFWRASFFILNFVHTVISEKMVILINSQYTIENNGCVLNKVQVIPECCLLMCLWAERRMFTVQVNICWLPKEWGDTLLNRSFRQISDIRIYIREHFLSYWMGRTWVYFLIFTTKTPYNSNAFFRIWGSNCSVVYIHFIGKIIESESYKRNHVLISI